MFTLLGKITPDLILLDIEMPEMDGFEALQRLKSDASCANIPVIFLTSITDASTEVRGFQLGVVDFISKPFSAPVLLNRIKTHLSIDELVRERTAQLERMQNGLVLVLAELVENRDKATDDHAGRIDEYVKILMDAMTVRGLYADEIQSMNLELADSASNTQDSNKSSILNSILNKPGSMTHEEFEAMKNHAAEGERIIGKIASMTGNNEFLGKAKLFSSYHHERWDGSGYPLGLKGTKIPLHGRIMAIVNAYDALLSGRTNKEPFTEEEAVRIIMADVGKHFDPFIAEVFLEVQDQFGTVRRRHTNK
jgi:putative two-component system response regulator